MPYRPPLPFFVSPNLRFITTSTPRRPSRTLINFFVANIFLVAFPSTAVPFLPNCVSFLRCYPLQVLFASARSFVRTKIGLVICTMLSFALYYPAALINERISWFLQWHYVIAGREAYRAKNALVQSAPTASPARFVVVVVYRLSTTMVIVIIGSNKLLPGASRSKRVIWSVRYVIIIIIRWLSEFGKKLTCAASTSRITCSTPYRAIQRAKQGGQRHAKNYEWASNLPNEKREKVKGLEIGKIIMVVDSAR